MENFDLDMDEWQAVAPDPGHTRRRVTQSKQTVRLFWMMKSILAKTLEQFPYDMYATPWGHLDFTKELQKIQFQLQQQSGQLSRIEQHIPCIPHKELPSSTVKDPALVGSTDDES